MHHTVVVSDVHLSEVHEGEGLWMRYRQREFSCDEDFASMIDALLERVRGHELSLVLNGDIFDFDAPTRSGGKLVFHDCPRSAAYAVPMLERILDDHPMFVAALGRLLQRGHSVVFVSGNHDAQLTLPEVRAVLRSRLECSAFKMGELDSPALGDKIQFRAWFHSVDGIHIEHGNQYDSFCSFRYPMAPYGDQSRVIQPTLGSLATRLLLSRMGYFNPHVDSSFMLSTWGYAAHWFRYYLFSRRSLAVAWARGAIRAVSELIRTRSKARAEREQENLELCVRETGVDRPRLERHSALFAPPSEDRLHHVVRELWLDRVGFLLGGLALLALALVTHALVLGGAILVLAGFVFYEMRVPKPTLDSTWNHVASMTRKVGEIHNARAVIFGHTHRAHGEWSDGVFLGNTGSWSSAYRDIECKEPLSTQKPIVWLVSDAQGSFSGGLSYWERGQFAKAVGPGEFREPNPPELSLHGEGSGIYRKFEDEARNTA